MANAQHPKELATLARPPGRETLLSIAGTPTAYIRLSPQFLAAIRHVAPQPRSRFLRVALALSIITLLAGAWMYRQAMRAQSPLPGVATANAAELPTTPRATAAATPASVATPIAVRPMSAPSSTTPAAPEPAPASLASSATTASTGVRVFRPAKTTPKTPRKPHRRPPR
jgi:hypothetical protein